MTIESFFLVTNYILLLSWICEGELAWDTSYFENNSVLNFKIFDKTFINNDVKKVDVWKIKKYIQGVVT